MIPCTICHKPVDQEDSYEARREDDGLTLGIHHTCLQKDLIRLREKQRELVFTYIQQEGTYERMNANGFVRGFNWHLTHV